jgi:hypothetical protein
MEVTEINQRWYYLTVQWVKYCRKATEGSEILRGVDYSEENADRSWQDFSALMDGYTLRIRLQIEG